MKKIYLTIFTITAAVASVFSQTVPTCSLNPAFIASNKIGIWPDSATNFVSGTVGMPYEQNITVKVPKDTTSSGFKFCFNKFVLYTPSGITNYNMPPGLNIGSSSTLTANGSVNGAPSLRFIGNANDCASIYGTPTTAGSYTLQLEIQPYVNGPSFSACPNVPNINSGSSSIAGPTTLKYYIINISSPTGLQEIGKDRMTLYQNVPNPFSASTDIKFYVEGEDNATVTVYNALGSVVSQQTIKTSIGENKVTINGSSLSSGTYIYTLKYKNAVTTKRMMVINN
ncbi:MAG: T9SS type A sorting domain-containing protein [Bacteroidetes bacterium]|nr:T9SS type A sorting domain-containing protein [Bacteroidota bacterium]